MDEDRFTTAAIGLTGRHCGMNPELTRFVRCRRDNTSTTGTTADYDRLAAQVRVVALFDGCKECIHIDVRDNAMT